MKKTIILVLLILLFAMITVHSEPSDLVITGANAYVLMDIKSGKVLAQHNADTPLYPASTTKILTAIVALENGELSDEMTASQEAVFDIGKDGMNIGIQAGEIIKMYDLLHALLIPSANETANILGENICDTRQDFIDLMNEKAKALGALNTHFENANGMHSDNHMTTAGDLGKIACYAMHNDVFRSIVKKTSYKMPATNIHSVWNPLYTSNILLKANNFDGYEITGVKTGYTDPAGRCLISSAKNDEGTELLVVVMGVRSGDTAQTITKISTKLFEYGFDNFKNMNIIHKNEYLGLMQVGNSRDNTPLVLLAQNDLDIFTRKNMDKSKLDIKINTIDNIKLPIKKEDIVGTADFYIDNELLGTINIVSGNNIYSNLPVKKDSDTDTQNNSESINKGTDDETNPSESVEADEGDKKNGSVLRAIGRVVIITLGTLVVLYLILALWFEVKKKMKYKKRR